MMCWYIFDGGSLYVEPSADGLFQIPVWEKEPVGLQTVMDFTWLDGSVCKAAVAGAEARERLKGEWIPLRQCFGRISTSHYRRAGKAAELLDWNAQNIYCGHCGTPLRLKTDIRKYCPACEREVWAKLSPAVIVLISKGEEVLLVQSHAFKRDYYGLVSGFVEMGETLEECLRREVWEETRLEVENIRYFGSQVWPFPRNLMAGFFADYKSGELELQDAELKKGGWFRYDNLPPVPEKLSIARRLIDSWRSSFV